MIVLTQVGIEEMDTAIKKARVFALATFQSAQRMATVVEENAYARTVFDHTNSRLDEIERVFVNIMQGRYG
jgi:hypothetical protein